MTAGLSTMTELFFAHAGRCSDKWEHYLDAYESEFAAMRARGEPIDLLEIGVQEGGSLEIWQKAFPPGSRIAGLDVDPRVAELAFPPGIEVIVGDGASAAVLAAAFPGRRFDVVIDDGSHECADVLATFAALFPRVRPGGLYVIEDLHCSYWPSHGGGLRRPDSAIEWLKALIDTLNADHWPAAEGTAEELARRDLYRAWVERVTFYDSMAVVAKRRRALLRRQRRVLTGAVENHSRNLASVAAAFLQQPEAFVFSMHYAGLVADEIGRSGGAADADGAADPARHIAPAPVARADAGPAEDAALEGVLQAMIEHVAAQPPRFQPSRFWTHVLVRTMAQLRRHGLGRFKRMIDEGGLDPMPTGTGDRQFRAAAMAWARDPDVAALQVRMEAAPGLEGAGAADALSTEDGRTVYCAFVGMVWHLARTEVPNGLCDMLSEPGLGDPIRMSLRGRAISRDLGTSIRERNTILAPFEDRLSAGWRAPIVEVGAGYGRLAYVVLCSAPCRYVIVDVPPALHISQWYLTTVLPDRTAFRFRPWTDFAAVAGELQAADVAFLTPDQFARLPAGFFAVGIAIGSLGGMTREQCGLYLDLFDHTVTEGVYIKQRVEQVNAMDEVAFVRSDFAMKPGWRPAVDRLDAVQELFFETLWLRG